MRHILHPSTCGQLILNARLGCHCLHASQDILVESPLCRILTASIFCTMLTLFNWAAFHKSTLVSVFVPDRTLDMALFSIIENWM